MTEKTLPLSRFDSWLRRYATQATTALALVVGLSGIVLFFHLARGPIETAHEWLGIVFIGAVLLHGFRHRQNVVRMLSDGRLYALLGASVVALALFLAAPQGTDTKPPHRLVALALEAPLTHLAPIIGIEADEAQRRLAEGGLAVAHSGQSLQAIATANHVDPMRALGLVLGRMTPAAPSVRADTP